jgi:galactofuranose transport system ATP-binding protein
VSAVQPVLEAREVSKRFLGVVALEGVSLQLYPGEVHALVGENGAGKSTLIKVLTGLYQPDDGEVRYRGEPVSFEEPRDAWDAGIATTYQEIGLVPQMSVGRNLFLGREPRTRLGLLDIARMHADAAELLGRYGITVDVRREVGDLGVAIRQMVAIVRAVSVDARVVILDEPTSSLEPREVDRLAGVVAMLRQQGVALLYVTHKLDEVFRMCDRVTVLRDGRRVHTGDVAALSRLELVSKMLGRDVSELASRGVTGFDEEHDAGSDVVLRASGLSRRNLLHDVSLDIREGEVVALAGLLGSGRSETAMAIFGDQRLDSGDIEIDGAAVRRGSPAAAIAAGIAMLPEDRKAEGLIPTLSVRENIVLAALPALTRFGVVSRKRVDVVVDRFLARLRIKASSGDQKVSQLSGGNQQKVLLARMLALDPRVLMLDEPTRGIDVGAKAEVQSLIDELARDGQAVLLISSELEEIVEGADRVVVLKDGTVIATLQGDEITEGRIMSHIASATPADPGAAHG